uniref:Secreted protein n=1 Tax=Ascaris lumbricoides TaxID=6252 RepID=A0A0M3HQF9_ASCLU
MLPCNVGTMRCICSLLYCCSVNTLPSYLSATTTTSIGSLPPPPYAETQSLVQQEQSSEHQSAERDKEESGNTLTEMSSHDVSKSTSDEPQDT